MTAGGTLKPPSLIDRAILLVKGFNPATQTGDSYADDALEVGTAGAKAVDSDTVFLKQVTRKEKAKKQTQIASTEERRPLW